MLLSAVTVLAAGVAARPHIISRQSAAQSFASSNDGTLKLSPQDAPVLGTGNANGQSTWSLAMDDSDAGARQAIGGFGAAVTDSTVANYNALPADQKAQLIKDMVSADGAGFQLLRHTIASSDMSPNAYSYDDNNGQPDTSLAGFNLGDSGNAMASMLKDFRAAQSNLTILGSSWSAPKWMTIQDQGADNYNTFDTQYSDPFAQYFVKYLQAFSDAGAPIDAITIQNEPNHNDKTDDVDFTMGVDAQTSANLIQNNVGPALKSANLNTQIWAFDHNTDDPDYPSTVLSTAGDFVNTVAWHCYQSGGPDWNVLSDFHNDHEGVTQYMTECYTYDQDKWTTTIDFTMAPLQNWASGSISWPMGTDTAGNPHLPEDGACGSCRGIFQTDGSSYSLQTDYYMLAQFSKWMPKGAIVHGTTGSYTFDDGTGVQSVSSVNPDGSRVVVMSNTYNNPIYVTVNTTSEQWSGTLYPESLTTWVLPASSS